LAIGIGEKWLGHNPGPFGTTTRPRLFPSHIEPKFSGCDEKRLRDRQQKTRYATAILWLSLLRALRLVGRQTVNRQKSAVTTVGEQQRLVSVVRICLDSSKNNQMVTAVIAIRSSALENRNAVRQ
jgi:hypothetical protein